MESSSGSSERRHDPVLDVLLEGFGAVLKQKGRLVQSDSPEDGSSFVLSDSRELATYGVTELSYRPRYYFDGEEFPESLTVEMDDDGLDKTILFSRYAKDGRIETAVRLDAPIDESEAYDVDRLARGLLTEEEIARIVSNLELEMQQTIETEDVLMLQCLLDDLRLAYS